MRVVVAGLGAARADEPFAGFDPNRLRRMDRYGRLGFVAGSRALAAAGYVRPSAANPRAGVVFATAYGCRDSITEHAILLRGARAVEELRPAVFAQTVHNSVGGELAIDWALGGISETLTPGVTGAVEALLLAGRRLEGGAADLVVAGFADAFHDEMLHRNPLGATPGAWAAVLVRRAARPGELVLAGGAQLFEPDAAARAARLRDLVGGSPVLDAASPLGLAAALEELGDGGPARVALVAEDPRGAAALAFLEKA